MLSSEDVQLAIRKALSQARVLPKPDLSGDLVIISSSDALPAARVLYVGVVSSGARAILLGPTEASVLLMPYREVPKVVVYALSPWDSRAVRATEEAILLGSDVYLVSPSMHEALEVRLTRHRELKRVEVSGSPPLMTMILASALWSPRPLGSRGGRLESELKALDGAPQWILEKFSREAAEVSSLREFTAYYTPAVEPGARYLCAASSSCSGSFPLEELGRHREAAAVLMETTSESHDYSDVELALGSRIKAVKVLINTDPITAGVYSALFGALAAGKVI
ncbi:MAG: hypothetical protein ACP5HK_06875 [Acidilobus sp.]